MTQVVYKQHLVVDCSKVMLNMSQMEYRMAQNFDESGLGKL